MYIKICNLTNYRICHSMKSSENTLFRADNYGPRLTSCRCVVIHCGTRARRPAHSSGVVWSGCPPCASGRGSVDHATPVRRWWRTRARWSDLVDPVEERRGQSQREGVGSVVKGRRVAFPGFEPWPLRSPCIDIITCSPVNFVQVQTNPTKWECDWEIWK